MNGSGSCNNCAIEPREPSMHAIAQGGCGLACTRARARVGAGAVVDGDEGAGSVCVACSFLMRCTLQLNQYALQTAHCGKCARVMKGGGKAGAALACVVVCPCRQGDVCTCVAAAAAARNKCGWELKHKIKMRFSAGRGPEGWSAAQGSGQRTARCMRWACGS
jgi:hypothetical protein